jgi:serpin B
MGLTDAFGDADFSGIDGTLELFIDDIYHQGFLSVDEAGTEASAASAIVMARKGIPMVEVTLQVDQPFIYLIRDIETGAILFLGHVVNPVGTDGAPAGSME